ncbi:unnamed protein product [Allacma fusca]|uniref:Cell division control protein 45 n=1 Tax=Allacma fusca TaxID=39272 RepID=A0A8J2PN60_9HEXA|nr:unnamed protein product [Allacma fusca]
MFIEHLRKDFYEQLPGSRPLIIAAPDVDAVCTVKILQFLFNIDGIAYTLVSAEGNHELKEHFVEFREQVKNIILVNCGGTIDVLALLDNPENVIIYIIDSHRPTHILNIYDDSQQVRIVIPPGEQELIPAFDDIFRDDIESDDDDSQEDDSGLDEEGEEGDGGGSRKRRRRLEPTAVEKRRERRDWQEKRRRVLFDYSQFSYYGPPASLIMLEVAWTMSRGGPELVWYSIVGLTDSYIMKKIDRQHYILLAHQLQSHVARLKHSQQNQRDAMKLLFEKEICLHLYRHWNIHESLAVTPYFACKFKFWTGEKQMNRFLLDIGLPLSQCRQKLVAMDLNIRKALKDMFEKKADKWNMDEITIPSFTRQVGLRRKYSAIDCHWAALAVLESPANDLTMSERFKSALDCLPAERMAELDKGVEAAKILLKTIRQQVQAFLDTHTVVSLGPFLLATISTEGIDTKYFVNQNSLILLARFTLMAAVDSSNSRKAAGLPLIMIVPQSADVFLLIGLPPLAADSSSNLFGKAFERVAECLEEGVAMDAFESFIVQVKAEKKKKFIDKLLEIME